MSSSLTTRFPALAASNEMGQTFNSSTDRPTVGAEPSDEALLARICAGDQEALACLFRRYARIVRGVAYRVLRDPSEADDLLQDIFILIHNECTKFDSSRGPARFWILQMTYRRAISRRRYLDTRHFYTRSDLEEVERTHSRAGDDSGRYPESIEGVLGSGALERMFAALSENQQRTLRLFFFEGYTLEEIAAKLNQTRGNVKNHYFRGLERLRQQIFGQRHEPERALSAEPFGGNRRPTGKSLLFANLRVDANHP